MSVTFLGTAASLYEVDVESPESVDDLDVSFRKLAKLKQDGLLSDEEYEQKRAEIMQRRS